MNKAQRQKKYADRFGRKLLRQGIYLITIPAANGYPELCYVGQSRDIGSRETEHSFGILHEDYTLTNRNLILDFKRKKISFDMVQFTHLRVYFGNTKKESELLLEERFFIRELREKGVNLANIL